MSIRLSISRVIVLQDPDDEEDDLDDDDLDDDEDDEESDDEDDDEPETWQVFCHVDVGHLRPFA